MSSTNRSRVVNVHLILVLALAALAMVAGVQPVAANATFNVNSTADAPDANLADGVCLTAAGECTLRAALEQANHLSDGVASFFITMYTPGTYTLTDQLIVTGENIFIYGTGNEHDVIIDGNGATRVFDIGGGSIGIFWVTIQGGKNVAGAFGHWHGGAIHNHGNLTLSNVIVQDSVIASDTPLAATCVTHCGGAMYNAANATLHNVAFVNNRNEFDDPGAHGGAIANAGTLTVTNATFSDNSTTGGQGTAIYSTGTTDLTHVTVADNGAGSAIAHAGGMLTLAASILAINTGPNCDGSITSDGYNLSDDASCTLAGTGDLDNNPNANLGPLIDNGGNTWTHALLEGSVAINHMPPPCLEATDQRGETRPQGAGCDIGAFEVIFVQTYFQACLYAGSLSQVSFIGESASPTLNCGRGTPVVLLAGGDPGVDVYHACLYAGSLSQVGETAPASCGRGEVISLVKGTDLQGCLYAGSLSRLSTSPPSSCGRGVEAGLETEP